MRRFGRNLPTVCTYDGEIQEIRETEARYQKGLRCLRLVPFGLASLVSLVSLDPYEAWEGLDEIFPRRLYTSVDLWSKAMAVLSNL